MSARSGRMDRQQEREAGLSADEVARSSIEEWKHTFAHAVLAASAEGIEKAIMDYKESVEDILRPLVEATVEDNRFDALRWPIENDEGGGWRIDASMGAIVRAAAACGLKVEIGPHAGAWQAIVQPRVTPFPFIGFGARPQFGDTPEEAAARALVAAQGEMT